MKFLPKSLAASIGSAALLAFSAGFVPAHAQDAQTPQQTPQQATPTPPAASEAQVDETTLRAFAQASLDVEEVISNWSPRIQAAESEEQAQELRSGANQEIQAALQDNGLEVQTYNQVYQLAQADPEVATTIHRYREELQ